MYSHYVGQATDLHRSAKKKKATKMLVIPSKEISKLPAHYKSYKRALN